MNNSIPTIIIIDRNANFEHIRRSNPVLKFYLYWARCVRYEIPNNSASQVGHNYYHYYLLNLSHRRAVAINNIDINCSHFTQHTARDNNTHSYNNSRVCAILVGS